VKHVFAALVLGSELLARGVHGFLLPPLRFLTSAGVLLQLVAEGLLACIQLEARLTEGFLIPHGLLVRFLQT
jgi:hypothetical protein